MMTLKSGRMDRQMNYKYVWVPVALGLAVICGESTQVMGGGNTQIWLLHLINMLHAQALTPGLVELNVVLRKCGHFCGYGFLGVLAGRAWSAQIRRRLLLTWTAVRTRGAALGVATAFLIACADEYHQSFLPGRSSSFHDVMIDTSGALLLNAIYFAVLANKRRNLIQYLSALRATNVKQNVSESSLGLAA
jgi:VanZ family protein